MSQQVIAVSFSANKNCMTCDLLEIEVSCNQFPSNIRLNHCVTSVKLDLSSISHFSVSFIIVHTHLGSPCTSSFQQLEAARVV